MDLDLNGRAYVVSGGTRGVGRAIVEALLMEGAFVATCARDVEGCIDLLQSTPEDGRHRLLAEVCDVRDAATVAAFVDGAADRFGRMDGIVTNAGAGVFGGALETPPEQWHAQFALKIDSVMNLVRPALAHMQHSDAPRIVVINGVTAHATEPDLAAVSATRAAVASLTRSLALELAPQSILVNAVSLGAIVTDRQRARHAAAGTDENFEQWCISEAARRGVPLGRLGEPHEVAPTVALLLSPVSSYTTGTSVDVSGGVGGRT